MKILLSAYTGLGNLVLKTPMIRKFRELYPEGVVDLIGGSAFGIDQLVPNIEISKYHFLSEKTGWLEKVQYFMNLRKEKYDAILVPFDAAPFFLNKGASSIGAGQIIRHYITGGNLLLRFNNARKRALFTRTTWVQATPGKHEIDLNFDLLEALHQKPFQRDYQTALEIDSDDIILDKFEIPKTKYVIIQPDAANGILDAKVWHRQNFIDLIDQLLKETTTNIVLVGDKGDYVRTIKAIDDKFSEEQRVINTAGLTSIADLLLLLKRASLVLCHDSAVMHIADAMNVRLVALYGPTDYNRTKPLKPTSEVLFSNNEFLGIMSDWKVSEKYLSTLNKGNKMMSGITVNKVASKMKQLLDQQG